MKVPQISLITLAFLLSVSVARNHSGAAELEVVFSDRPNPKVTLEETEYGHLGRMIAEASPASPQDPARAFPSRGGYGRVVIRGWPADEPMSSLWIHGKNILVNAGTNRSWFHMTDTRLERYLVELAAAKGVIDEGLHREIQLEIEKNSPTTLFLDDFKPPLDPIWSGGLPATTNTWPRELYSYTGAASYVFEIIGGANVLRLTNTLGRFERRGWSTGTNFVSGDFRCEARFNLLDYRSSRGGIIELWVLDSRDPDNFIFTSLFSGLSSAPVAFAAASSVNGDFDAAGWFNARSDTFYRLVLEVSNSGKIRAALLTDFGEEIFAYAFQRNANAFLDGFTIGISHCGTPLTGASNPLPSEAAVDFVHLAGTDTAARDRRLTLYGFEHWAGQTTTRYDTLVSNWTPDFAALSVTNFLLRAEGVWTNSQKASNYIFEDPDAPGVVLRLRTWEGSNVISAHLALMDQLAIVADPEPLPLASTLGIDLGDRSYLDWGAADSVLFSRNNLFIYLSGGPSVLKLARRLDNELVLHSFRGPALLQPGFSSGVFNVAAATIPGKNYALESKDSVSATNWTTHRTFRGDGTVRTLTVPASSPQEFLRLRLE